MRAFIGRSAHPEPGFDANHSTRNPEADQTFFVPPTQASFGPHYMLLRRLLLREGEKLVPFRSRSLEVMTDLLELRGGSVTKQDLMTRAWPNVFVEPANPTVDTSTLRHGGDGHRLVVSLLKPAAT